MTSLYDRHHHQCRDQPACDQQSAYYLTTKKECIEKFETWTESEQIDFVQSCLSKMSHCQHSQINTYLKPILQRDFISLLPSKYWLFSYN